MGAVCPVPAWASEARARAWGTQRRRLWSGREAWRVQVGSAPPGGARATPHAHRRHSSRPIHCRSARAQPCAAARRGAVLCVCGTACEAYPGTAAGRVRHALLTRQAGMAYPSRRALPARARRRRLSRATDVHLSTPAQSVVQPTTRAVVGRSRTQERHEGIRRRGRRARDRGVERNQRIRPARREIATPSGRTATAVRLTCLTAVTSTVPV